MRKGFRYWLGIFKDYQRIIRKALRDYRSIYIIILRALLLLFIAVGMLFVFVVPLFSHQRFHPDNYVRFVGIYQFYTNLNLFSSRLVWLWGKVILLYIASIASLKSVQNFSCGYGVSLPYLMIDNLNVHGEEAGWK